MNDAATTGVLGATSAVGMVLIPRLLELGYRVIAFSRSAHGDRGPLLEWRQIEERTTSPLPHVPAPITHWISAAPLWALTSHLPLLSAHGAKRVVALSSTSRFTKSDSSDLTERRTAERLARAENALQLWAEEGGREWIILRPTMIYGGGRDKNIAEIARFIRRWSFFPLVGEAAGRRQPVRVDDVASACLAALEDTAVANRAYNISGGETISYREMVCRVFSAMGKRPAIVTIPPFALRLALHALHLFPRYRHVTMAMADRMSRDLVSDHHEAADDLDFHPRPFTLLPSDVGLC